jgi:signal transduction histidine kinase
MHIGVLSSGPAASKMLRRWCQDVCPEADVTATDASIVASGALRDLDVLAIDGAMDVGVATALNEGPSREVTERPLRVVLVDPGSVTAAAWATWRNVWRADAIVPLDEETPAREVFARLGAERRGRVEQRRALADLRRLNQEREALTVTLERQVEAQTRQEEERRHEIASRVNEIRSLIRSIHELSLIQDLESLMNHLRQEARRYPRIENPVLAFRARNGELNILHYHGPQFVRHRAREPWVQSIRIRINSAHDSQYLANQLGRPFGRVLAVPLVVGGPDTDSSYMHSAVLFLEHDLDAAEEPQFIDYISKRLQAFAVALDRLLLERDLRQVSLMWEKNFDGFDSPIAIVDLDGQILRANDAFDREAWLRDSLDGDGRLRRPLQECLASRQRRRQRMTHVERQFDIHFYPIRMADREEATTAVLQALDVTRTQLLQSQMIQNEKMAAIGHLAGNIAHELNNPLTGIRAMAQVLLLTQDPASRMHEDLRDVEVAAERCQRTIRNLLDFAKGEVRDRATPSDLNEIVEKTLPLLKTAMGEFEQHVSLSADPLGVVVEPHLMGQVVFNLVNNACQATAVGGRIEIQTERRERDGRSWAVLRVRDTGCGIAEEIKNKIFDPFFTTKQDREGTGLGLSMSRQVVERFGGLIEFDSQEGAGSVFHVFIPLRDAP